MLNEDVLLENALLRDQLRVAKLEIIKARVKEESAALSYKGVRATQETQKDALRAIRKTLNDQTLGPAAMLGAIYRQIRSLEL